MATERIQNFSELVREPTIRRQNPRKLSHLVARDLRGLILRGVLGPDQALPSESELMYALHVSRNTLREALRILEAESLIEVRRGRAGGAVVRRPDPTSVARSLALLLQVRGARVPDIQGAREILEPLCAGRTIEPAALVGGLARLTERHEAEVAAVRDPERFLAAMDQFDRSVLALSSNKPIALLAGSIHHILINQRRSNGGAGPSLSQRRQVAALHGDFLRLVGEADPEAAQATWAEYVAIAGNLPGKGAGAGSFDAALVWSNEDSDTTDSRRADTMAASIATELRTRIARGELVPGDQLPSMPELAAAFEVSRPTMRECLRVLEMEGLVDLRTGSRSGTTVLGPTAEAAAHLATIILASLHTRMADVAEALAMCESPLIELVALRIDATSLEQVDREARVLREKVHDTIGFMEAWEKLSTFVFYKAGNPAASVVWETLYSVSMEYRRDLTITALSLPKVIRGNRSACRALEAFIESARKRDPAGARAAWEGFHEAISPYFRSALGDRLIVDLFE